MAKEDSTKFEKECTLQGFGKEVRQHLFCGTVMNGDFVVFDMVSDKKVTDIDVTCALTR